MKRFYQLLIPVLCLFTFSGCDKMLEEEPQNKLKPSTFSDYNELLNFGYPGGKEYGEIDPLDFYVEFMTDDADIRYFNPDRSAYAIIPFSWSETHEDPSMLGGYDQAWKNNYLSIYYANVVIENIDAATGGTMEKAYLKGEAHVLRAFAFFNLVNLYAPPYNEATAATDLAVPLKLDPVVQAESYTRNTLAEVYAQIDEDMETGIALMEANDVRESSKFKLNPVSAHLLASRMALYRKDYDGVILHANKVISVNPELFDLSGYNFNTARGWGYGGQTNYFGDANNNVLFKYGSNEYYNYFYTPGALAISDDLQSIYEEGDIRLYYFTYPSGIGRVYYKYRPYPMYPGNQIRAFRVEEAYLNRAEAYVMKDMSAEALADLNHIRRYKFDVNFKPMDPDYFELTSTMYPTTEDVVAVVREERRRELCFEFHRWYDLRRYGMPRQEHEYAGETFVLEENDPRYTLQIPQRELDYNPLMNKNPR